MHTPWKVATLASLALGVIVGTSTLTTAYLVRPPVRQSEELGAPTLTTAPPPPRAAVVRIAPVRTKPAPLLAAAVTPAAESATPAPSEPPIVRPAPRSPATAPAECETGSDRAGRIAKPGALGALLGAGLGATGGAIANGGKGAGQGALIGGLAGAALGAGYGAYKTNAECGTILGNVSGTPPARGGAEPGLAVDTTAPFAATPARGDRTHVYEVR